VLHVELSFLLTTSVNLLVAIQGQFLFKVCSHLQPFALTTNKETALLDHNILSKGSLTRDTIGSSKLSVDMYSLLLPYHTSHTRGYI